MRAVYVVLLYPVNAVAYRRADDGAIVMLWGVGRAATQLARSEGSRWRAYQRLGSGIVVSARMLLPVAMRSAVLPLGRCGAAAARANCHCPAGAAVSGTFDNLSLLKAAVYTNRRC